MAHVYFGNPEKTTFANVVEPETSDTSKPTTEKKEKSWGESMKWLMDLMEFITRYRIYRIFKLFPEANLNAAGHVFGKFFLGNRSVQKKMRNSIKAFYPNMPYKRQMKLVDASSKYMGQLMLDFMFRLPQTCDSTVDHYYRYTNFHLLENALKEGRGVIIPTVHIGEFLHMMSAIFQHPNKFLISSVAQINNLPIYRYNNRKWYDNLFVYASVSFKYIKNALMRDLKKNHIIVMYHDYSNTKQLRVPLMYGTYPYLIHTPQSYISMIRQANPVVLPAVALPDKQFGKTEIRFLDNSHLMEIIKDAADLPKREFHGIVSTEINRTLYPFVKAYVHNWEEIMNFAKMRLADKVRFSKGITHQEILQQAFEKMHQILENSYEPERPDAKLEEIITQYESEITKIVQNPQEVFSDHKTVIRLDQMSATQELMKIAEVLAFHFGKRQESKLAEKFTMMIQEFQRYNYDTISVLQNYEQVYNSVMEQQEFSQKLTQTLKKYWRRYISEQKLVEKWHELDLSQKLKHFQVELSNSITQILQTIKQEYSQATLTYETFKTQFLNSL